MEPSESYDEAREAEIIRFTHLLDSLFSCFAKHPHWSLTALALITRESDDAYLEEALKQVCILETTGLATGTYRLKTDMERIEDAFRIHSHWSLARLAYRLQLEEAYLRELLEEVAFFVDEGPLAGAYMLKPPGLISGDEVGLGRETGSAGAVEFM